MSLEASARRLVSRIEDRVEWRLGRADRASLAFSGGLGSLLTAALVRKRCDLTCFVVATPTASDRRAARTAQRYLDFRVEFLHPSRPVVLARGQALRQAHPRWPLSAILDALPSATLLSMVGGCRFTGHSSPPRDARVLRWLRSAGGFSPLAVAGTPVSITRPQLVAAAYVLGLPATFARVPHRSPARGSGLDRLFEDMARARGLSVGCLLRQSEARGDR